MSQHKTEQKDLMKDERIEDRERREREDREKCDRERRDVVPHDRREKDMMGQGRGTLDKKIYDFEEFHIPQKGEYREVRNEVYCNVSLDKDGKQKYERTFDRSVAQSHDGKLIAERRQRYEDDTGMQRETHERQLDKKGLKQINERNERGEWVTSYKKRDIEDDEDFRREFKEHNDLMTRPLSLKLWDAYPQLQ